MINVIGLTQFVFLSLGLMVVNILVKATAGQTSQLALFLAKYGLWFFLIPVLWVVIATVTTLRNKSTSALMVTQVSGIIITALIFLAFGVAILRP